MGKMIPIGIIIRCAMENFIECERLGTFGINFGERKTGYYFRHYHLLVINRFYYC